MAWAPSAAAPSISAASAIRLRSRTVSWTIGAAPASATNAVAATADMRTAAPAPSVMLIASANVASSAACRRQASASAPRGGTSSVVTVNPSNVSRRIRGSLGTERDPGGIAPLANERLPLEPGERRQTSKPAASSRPRQRSPGIQCRRMVVEWPR